jgi:hypothetical protein
VNLRNLPAKSPFYRGRQGYQGIKMTGLYYETPGTYKSIAEDNNASERKNKND